ncbi:RNase adapter RapZ [Heliorestis acidaminivorans]|uniref:RNase adapter RapZ n=1 Tax=Heliorestis acidaminivorans TaxID=553427 RepID=A0A6I0F4F6_9FIRM|nr:RNase adapter RapZ [Heliorestis acidaminivorans]KAB2952090.1 RNase adapter RapZ [Heliorestis acidaminivorans]
MEKIKDHTIEVVIITGLSGAGKSQAIRVFEDLGFFCVDNLPPNLLPKFGELIVQSTGKIKKIALVIDIRGREFFSSLNEGLDELQRQGLGSEIFFLEASDETLIRRFKESRRRHPLSESGRILDGIQRERTILSDLRGRANWIIDTTDLSVQNLRRQIVDMFAQEEEKGNMKITLMSFGFKYGVPRDVDLLMDVRFLPNPHYIPELKPLTGNDEAVQNYVMKSQATRLFLRKFYSLLRFLIPHYVKEGKSHLVIAIGCTGGKHRSVTLANRLAQSLSKQNYSLTAKHRDIEKDRGGEERT